MDFSNFFSERPITADIVLQKLMLLGAMYVEENNILQAIHENIDDEEELQDVVIEGFCSLSMNMDDVNPDDVKDLLSQAWNIEGRHDLMQILDQLLAGLHQNLFDELVEKNKSKILPLKEFTLQSRVARVLEGMNEDDYTVLVNEAKAASVRWAQDGIIAWDWARYVHLLRLGFLAEILKQDECWKLLKNLQVPVSMRFKDWDGFGRSYLNGRTFWQGSASPMDEVCRRLMTDPYSPWKRFNWL